MLNYYINKKISYIEDIVTKRLSGEKRFLKVWGADPDSGLVHYEIFKMLNFGDVFSEISIQIS